VHGPLLITAQAFRRLGALGLRLGWAFRRRIPVTLERGHLSTQPAVAIVVINLTYFIWVSAEVKLWALSAPSGPKPTAGHPPLPKEDAWPYRTSAG